MAREWARATMEEPLTEELLHELLHSDAPECYLETNQISARSLSEYLELLLTEKGLKRADVLRAADLNPTFGYQIFKGQRAPSRNKVLQITFAMGCTLQETNRCLQAAQHNELYCKNRRDAIIIFCVSKQFGLHATNEELYRFGEDTIC